MIACDFCAIKLRNFYDFRDADLDAPICNHHVGMMNPVLFFSDFDAVALFQLHSLPDVSDLKKLVNGYLQRISR